MFQHYLQCNQELTFLYQTQATLDFTCSSANYYVFIFSLHCAQCLGSPHGWLSWIVDLVSNAYTLFLESGNITAFNLLFFNEENSRKPVWSTESVKHKREDLGGTRFQASRSLYGFRARGLNHNINMINTEHSCFYCHILIYFSVSGLPILSCLIFCFVWGQQYCLGVFQRCILKKNIYFCFSGCQDSCCPPL